ncbi:DUF1753-domain-containing protein [Meredithblackwellia eburnea MCA 4105]
MFRITFAPSFPLATSFAGRDLKLGVSVISLFALLNKVAGAYGILAVFTGGAEGTQLTMYLYSIGTIAVFIWGIKKINEENGPKTLLYAHLFAIDHLISTAYTALFGVIWYIYVPHDGERVANSEAQKEMMGGGSAAKLDPEARKAAALALWQSERGFSAAVIVGGWLLKVYFIICLYSFALHLRRGTYHQLPASRPSVSRRTSHTRHSSTGGPRYSHLRGASVATIDTSTDTTLAETLWEEDEPVRFDLANKEDEIKSPVAARGTGMTRSVSGGVNQRDNSVTSTPVVGGSAADGPFARILSRLSGEFER